MVHPDTEALLTTAHIESVAPERIADGITRRVLSTAPHSVQVFDIAAGVTWPVIDHHQTNEFIWVLEGELIEGDRRFTSGSLLHYRPGSSHQPRSDVGARILVWEPHSEHEE